MECDFAGGSCSSKMPRCHHPLRRRRRLGQSIARKKILKQSDYSVVIHPPEHEWDPSPIVNVAFLDSQQTILSADWCGKISLHRLPIGRSKPQKVLEIPSLQEDPMLVKLFPLADGQSFCVGLPNGNFRVYSPDRCGTHTPLAPIVHSSLQCHEIRGAKRRYHRSFRETLWSSMKRHHDKGITNLSHFSEITDWECQPLSRPNSYDWTEQLNTLPGRYLSVDEFARWAFRETPSSILAAFVDPERDCFTVLDDRTVRPVVYCHGPARGQEDITAVCFVSDQALLTSHLYQGNGDRFPRNALKLWDIRMSTKPASLIEDVSLPSFPNERVRKCEPETEWFVSNNDDGPPTMGKTDDSNPCYSQHITSLIPFDDSSVLITIQSESRCPELVLYDLVHSTVRWQNKASDSTQIGKPLVAVSSNCIVSSAPTRTKLSFFDPLGQKCRKRPPKDVPSLAPNTEDRYGVPTRLTSLAWNANGTCLVGGSMDGDLFVWDGISE